MPAFLVVMDESREALAALRYAAGRAARRGAVLELLAIIEPTEFVQWGGVQAAMEEEARLRAEAMVLNASSAVAEEAGIRPTVTVRQGEPAKAVAEHLKERDDIAALVLGAASEGAPGPLVTHFANVAGSLACPLIIVPAGLSDEALNALG
jgi:nucleotide-binding universal stress UspA family protein